MFDSLQIILAVGQRVNLNVFFILITSLGCELNDTPAPLRHANKTKCIANDLTARGQITTTTTISSMLMRLQEAIPLPAL